MARLLRVIADRLEEGFNTRRTNHLYDYNGNNVGQYEFATTPDVDHEAVAEQAIDVMSSYGWTGSDIYGGDPAMTERGERIQSLLEKAFAMGLDRTGES